MASLAALICMAATIENLQAFLRQTLMDDVSDWKTDVVIVRLKSASSSFTAKKDGIGTIVSSGSAGSAFTFRIDDSFDVDSLGEVSRRSSIQAHLSTGP